MRKSNLGKSRSKRRAESAARAGSSPDQNGRGKRTGNDDFTRTAKRVDPLNNHTPSRGGIRL